MRGFVTSHIITHNTAHKLQRSTYFTIQTSRCVCGGEDTQTFILNHAINVDSVVLMTTKTERVTTSALPCLTPVAQRREPNIAHSFDVASILGLCGAVRPPATWAQTNHDEFHFSITM
jgi:hypothetical protein